VHPVDFDLDVWASRTMDVGRMFGRNVRRERRLRDITQEDLAHDAGIDRTYLSALERTGSINPTLRVMDGLARALGIPIARLLEDDTSLGSPNVKGGDGNPRG
jgi:transcriptional regulator with XRE-family HTH domain